MEIQINVNSYEKIWHKKNHFLYWHREDGPAYIRTLKPIEERWYLNNKYYSEAKEMPMNLYLAYCRWEYKKEIKNV